MKKPDIIGRIILSVLLIAWSACSARRPSHASIDMFVPLNCVTSKGIYLYDCDYITMKCKRIVFDKVTGCEQIQAKK